MQTICPELLLQELRSGVPVVIVDVRDRNEVRTHGAIGGALSFPLDQLGPRIAELTGYRSRALVLVADRERASREAAAALELAGFHDVMVLEGGMTRWIELGYPIEQEGSWRTVTMAPKKTPATRWTAR